MKLITRKHPGRNTKKIEREKLQKSRKGTYGIRKIQNMCAYILKKREVKE